MTAPAAGWYVIADVNRYVGPFVSEREALGYYGWLCNTHGNHIERVQTMDDYQIAYVLSGDGLDKPGKFTRPNRVLLASTRNLMRLEDAQVGFTP